MTGQFEVFYQRPLAMSGLTNHIIFSNIFNRQNLQSRGHSITSVYSIWSSAIAAFTVFEPVFLFFPEFVLSVVLD